MFQAEGFALLLGFQRAHAIAVFGPFLPRHQFGPVNTILITHLGTILIARLIGGIHRHDTRHPQGKGKGGYG